MEPLKWRVLMSDLEAIQYRPAQPNEVLKTAFIDKRGTIGLVSSKTPETAVSLCDGSRVRIYVKAPMAEMFGIAAGTEMATCRKFGISEFPMGYVDGFVFDDGMEQYWPLQDFGIGVSMTVLYAPSMAVIEMPRTLAPAGDMVLQSEEKLAFALLAA